MPKISELPAANGVSGPELLSIVQDGVTKKISLGQLPSTGGGGIVPDGQTITTNSAGKAVVVGATPDSLAAADPTKVAAATLVVTVGGVDQKTTPAALIAGQGATPDSLSAAAAAALGAGTLVVTVGGVDKKTTGADLIASQVVTIDKLPTVTPDLADYIAIYDVSGAATGKATLSAVRSLLGTTSSSGTTTPANATTYAISTASTGTAGTAQPAAVAVSGTLSSAVVITLSDGAGGTFGGTVTLQAGTNPSGSTSYTPASAGTRTISGTNNGGLTNPSGPTVTVAAAASSGSSGAVGGAANNVPLVMSSPTYASRNDSSGLQMLTGGSGQASITLPSNKAWFVKVKGRTTTNYNYNSTPFLVITDAADTTHQIKASFNNRAMSVFDSDGGGGGDPSPVSASDGNIHDFALEALSGGGENAYIDGALVPNGSHSGVVAIGGAATLYIAGGTNTTLVTGVFDVRVYAGSLGSPGALLYEWLLNGNGAGS